MLIYAQNNSLSVDCPACGVQAGVACAGNAFNGPMVHERREKKANEDLG